MIDKESLASRCDSLFDSELGKKVYNSVNKTIDENNMLSFLKSGVAIGFSGGADSVLLLIILRKIQKDNNFALKALHVNHMIRGNSADSDEAFSKEFAEALGVEYESIKIDVPRYANENRLGVEESARIVRYRFFDEVLSKDSRLNAIATAHNSTDNLETFIFNLMRGSGIHGLTAIAPVRDNIVRPLISVSKKDVLALLTDAKIPFVTDETNFSVEYTRNYIRHEILPTLTRLASSPEDMANKAISNLRADADYLAITAERFYCENVNDGKISVLKLKELHPAILSRVLRLMCKEENLPTPEKVHIEKITELLKRGGNFAVDIPGEAKFLLKEAYCSIKNKANSTQSLTFEHKLKEGFNEIPELNIGIAVTNDEKDVFSSNVYKFSIQVKLSSAIIMGDLSVRNKKDGDSYYYGGMTRKVKKLFCDKKIPPSQREKTPLITDEKGIVWIPGFGVRDDFPKEKTSKWITVYEKIN